MNQLDYIIVGVLVLSVLVGMWRGFISEIMSLLSWVLALWLAWAYGPVVATWTWFRHSVHAPELRLAAGAGSCFLAALMLGTVLRVILCHLVQGSMLGGVDRLFGMCFGFVRGMLLVTVLVFLLSLTAFVRHSWWKHSLLLPPFDSAATWFGERVPQSVRQRLHWGACPGSLRYCS